MNISLRWLNRYLEPGVSAEEAQRALTFCGFPLESLTELDGGDHLLDVEVTSNRGDALSHLGLAREVAAATGRRFVRPEFDEPARGGNIESVFSLTHEVEGACPRFTAQVIKGVRIGPSPAWLAEAIKAVGQRPINNVVDVTNYLTFEYGQPAHVFDLARLAGSKLVIRWAKPGEMLTTLDGKARKLSPEDLVVADGERAQSLAGVIGGAESEVSVATVDVVLEAATWDPVVVRRMVRKHDVRTHASHRFERFVDARTVDEAARRAAAMIVDVAGGQLLGGADRGVLARGLPLAEPIQVDMRVRRCDDLLGVGVSPAEMLSRLRALEIDAQQRDERTLRCRIPPFRPDLTREVDLIEEVARTTGLDRLPVRERLDVVIERPQAVERASRALGDLLSGLGFFETITFSFVTPKEAALFAAEGELILELHEARRGAEPALRPSLIPSLLACRKRNQDGRVSVPGGVRLFETAAVYAQRGRARETLERRVLALLADVPGAHRGQLASVEQRQEAVRLVKGVVEAVAGSIAGIGVDVRPRAQPPASGWDASACADVFLAGTRIGQLGLISAESQSAYDLDAPCAAAELDLEPILTRYPPAAKFTPLPAFPEIERDLSIIVAEDVPWARVSSEARAAGSSSLEDVGFVGTYRGKQVGAGKKSVTLRLRFRDASRTLRHEEVDPLVQGIIVALGERVGASLRQ